MMVVEEGGMMEVEVIRNCCSLCCWIFLEDLHKTRNSFNVVLFTKEKTLLSLSLSLSRIN